MLYHIPLQVFVGFNIRWWSIGWVLLSMIWYKCCHEYCGILSKRGIFCRSVISHVCRLFQIGLGCRTFKKKCVKIQWSNATGALGECSPFISFLLSGRSLFFAISGVEHQCIMHTTVHTSIHHLHAEFRLSYFDILHSDSRPYLPLKKNCAKDETTTRHQKSQANQLPQRSAGCLLPARANHPRTLSHPFGTSTWLPT